VLFTSADSGNFTCSIDGVQDPTKIRRRPNE